jgi:uncharacterized protein
MERSERSAVTDWADRLVETIRGYGRVAVAFSGGVDSTVVAKAAQLAVRAAAVAVTGRSASLASGELEQTQRLAQLIGIRHVILDTDEIANPAYVRNDGTRCYFCKSELYDRLLQAQTQLGFDVIASGANLDDFGDYRPGLRAAAERAVRHPLQEAKLTKPMVRELASYWGLPNWDKPAAPCLSSRLAIGVAVTPERLQRVDRAEQILHNMGIAECRVRYHDGDHARIEVLPDDLSKLVEPFTRARLVQQLYALGFKFVSLDLEGFRSGALNVLVPEEMLVASPRSGSV